MKIIESPDLNIFAESEKWKLFLTRGSGRRLPVPYMDRRKSCVLDAIRLFKSAYGSYQQSELDLWSNEFQLNSRGGSGDFRGLLRDKNRALLIEGEIEISKREKKFLLGEGQWMLRELAWTDKFPHAVTYQGQLRTIATPTMLEMVKVVDKTVHEFRLTVLTNELKWRKARGRIEIAPSGYASHGRSRALELMFGFFMPEKMGIIDDHGSHRKSDREQLKHYRFRRNLMKSEKLIMQGHCTIMKRNMLISRPLMASRICKRITCVLDAIRLFKSAYGSYQQSELDLWSNEFQLNSRGGSGDFRGLLRDKNRALLIEGEIEIKSVRKNSCWEKDSGCYAN